MLVTSKDIPSDFLASWIKWNTQAGHCAFHWETRMTGVIYTDCSQFSYFPDSRVKYGILVYLSSAVIKPQDLQPVSSICLQ